MAEKKNTGGKTRRLQGLRRRWLLNTVIFFTNFRHI